MTEHNNDWLPGVHTAPNIQGDPDGYEIENRALDPDGHLLTAMQNLCDWRDRLVVDLGAGTGFYLPVFAETARHVFGIEPHAPSRLQAMRRLADLGVGNVSVCAGSAEQVFLPNHSVDLVHARFAYFWGPGCEPGLAELERIIAPGGAAIIIDNDLERGEFAGWLRHLPASMQRDQSALERFWQTQGFTRTRVMSEWRFESRADLERVARLEFGPEAAESILSTHTSSLVGHGGHRVSYGYCLYHRRY